MGDMTEMTDLGKVSSLLGWPEKRKEIESTLRGLLGGLPAGRVEPQVKVTEELESRSYTRRRVSFFVSEDEIVYGWLFVPDGKEETAAILCCHDKTTCGKDEPAGLDGNHRLAFAQHYAERGYITLAIDTATAGERTSVKRQPYDTEVFYKDNPGLSLAGKMLADHMQAVEAFSEIKRVDTARIGVIGHGLGGFNALMLAAFDDRVQACVSSNGFTRFATDKTPGMWADGTGLALIPEIAKIAAKKDAPDLDWEHILALAAPTAVQIITSVSNSIHVNPKSCQKAVNQAGRIYKLLGAQSALNQFVNHDGNEFTPESLEVADDWFERWL